MAFASQGRAWIGCPAISGREKEKVKTLELSQELPGSGLSAAVTLEGVPWDGAVGRVLCSECTARSRC